ncbi:hypothetical protein DRQ09_03040, partial [candidate division KSB1 bacterium]
NYPNPFNPSTTISVELSEPMVGTLDIYNSSGQLIKTLFSGSFNAGVNSFIWDGKDSSGNVVASGIYFYRFKSGNFIKTSKMFFIK